jgi:GGDEF domain-containing protein
MAQHQRVLGDDGSVSHYVATMSDITQRKAAEDKIKRLAFYDPLTQLPNRRLLLDRLQMALEHSHHHQKTGGLAVY